jgi:phage-related tail fiber protein
MTEQTMLSAAQALVAALEGTPGVSLDAARTLLQLVSVSPLAALSAAADQFYTLLTMEGATEFIAAQAAAGDVKVPFTHIALGDGNGLPVTPNEAMTGLVNEVYRVPITSITVDPNNSKYLILEAVIPTVVGGWTVNEVSAIGGRAGGLTLAVGNFPPTYKPMLSQGSARDMVVRMVIQVGNASVVSFAIDPSVAVATNQAIINAMNAHLLEVNPHPQYAMLADLVHHLMALDPHPMYAKGDVLTAHANDPHAHGIYLTSADLDAAMLAAKPNPALVHFRTTM